MLSNVLASDNSLHGSFYTREVLVVVFVQCFCLGNGCIYFGVICSLVLKGSNGILDCFCHCIHFTLLGNVLTTDNSLHGSFYTREVLVVVLVQCFCLGNGCIYFGVICSLVLQGSNGILDCCCHCIYLRLLGNVLVTNNSLHGSFYTREVLVVILVQCIYLGNSFINLSVVCIFVNKSFNGIFDCFRHCIYLRLLGNVLASDNSIDSSFNTREILVIILVQCFCLVNGCVYFGVICSLILKGSNRILYSFRHCIYLCLLCFTFHSANSVNGIFYRRIICIKAAIKSHCTCDGRIDSCVISENVIVIPHKSWMADSCNPLNARTGIGLKTSKYICGGKVCDGSTFSIRERRRAIFRVIRPIAIFYCAAEGISHPTSISIFIYAHVGRRNHTVVDCSRAQLVIRIPNNSANSGRNGVDNNLTIKPTIRNR